MQNYKTCTSEKKSIQNYKICTSANETVLMGQTVFNPNELKKCYRQRMVLDRETSV